MWVFQRLHISTGILFSAFCSQIGLKSSNLAWSRHVWVPCFRVDMHRKPKGSTFWLLKLKIKYTKKTCKKEINRKRLWVWSLHSPSSLSKGFLNPPWLNWKKFSAFPKQWLWWWAPKKCPDKLAYHNTWCSFLVLCFLFLRSQYYGLLVSGLTIFYLHILST